MESTVGIILYSKRPPICRCAIRGSALRDAGFTAHPAHSTSSMSSSQAMPQDPIPEDAGPFLRYIR